MKRTACFLIACLFFLSIVSQTEEKNSGKIGAPSNATGTPAGTLLNINHIATWYESNGEMERDPFTGNSGLTYPRGTATAIYASGLIWGGKVNDGKTPVIRVGGSDYNRGVQPGRILGLRTGTYEDANDPNVRIWRIRRDYAIADLRQDAAEIFVKALGSVTDGDIAAIRAQYKKDWQEWPAAKGAPFYDSNNDGIYAPQFDGFGNPKLYPQADEPGLANADQVIWFVCHDLAGSSQWASPQIGLEQQTTIWAYNREGALGNVAFKKFKLIYKGTATTPANATITDMYLCHWSDPDLGDAGDDYVGCDTLLSVGYVYNSKSIDKSYKPFGIAPSMGYDFLQGPIIPSLGGSAVFDGKIRPGYKNLPMTSFIYFAAGGRYSDPPHTAIGAIQWYQMLRGLPPTPQGPPDPPMEIDPITGKPTVFWLSGDPVTRTGWIDGSWDTPGDRRMMQNSGPFTMAVGDTQEVVVGVVGGIGDDYLSSINEMKQNDRTVQFVYNNLFTFIPPSFTATVSYPSSTSATIFLRASTSAGSVTTITTSLYRNDGSKVSDVQLFDDGAHNDGAANDGVFANSLSLTREQSPLSAQALVNGTYLIPAIDAITTAGTVEVLNPVITFDNFNGDGIADGGEYIQFGFTLKNSTPFLLQNLRINSLRDFAATVLPSLSASSQTSIDGNAGFSTYVPIVAADSTFQIPFAIHDMLNNTWLSKLTIPIVKGNFRRDTVFTASQNVVGNNDASINIVVYNASMVGQKYDVWFGGSGATRNWTLVKQLPGVDYATVTATMTAPQEVPAITNLPNAKGTGQFTINDAKDKITYAISVEGLSGTISGTHIHRGAKGNTGAVVKTLSFTGGTAAGTWSKSDASEPLADSLVTDFIAGNLYVNIHTATNPNGEIRGQISDGLLPREDLPPAVASSTPAIYSAEEKKFVGFSLYVFPAPLGFKSATQTSPTTGNVENTVNPEGTYKLIGPAAAWGGAKATESALEILFQASENWAIVKSAKGVDLIPGQTYFMRVPFATYEDTIRVVPAVADFNGDTLWNTIGNSAIGGKPAWDMIVGIADATDGLGNIIKYYSPQFPTFPPNTSLWKGRLANGVNHIARNIIFTNEKVDGIPPVSGTRIVFAPCYSIKIGDISTITLKLNYVKEIGNGIVPSEFSLAQNFPNPFNSSTHVQFTIAGSRHVTMKVYDILGREVETLVDQPMNSGTYSVEWNASRFASGVYFYQLRAHQKDGGQAGNFVSVKKMVLIK
jgi:hypothetical protein